MIINKYPIGLARVDGQKYYVSMPRTAKILSAGFQGDKMVIWAMVPHSPEWMEVRSFLILWTGENADEVLDDWTHLATLTAPDGLVYHIFQ